MNSGIFQQCLKNMPICQKILRQPLSNQHTRFRKFQELQILKFGFQKRILLTVLQGNSRQNCWKL